MSLYENISVGDKFGMLTVKKIFKKKNKKGHNINFINADCECGSNKDYNLYQLTSGGTVSCGCLKNEQLIKRSTIHNQRHSHLYEVWKTMKQRCSNPNHISYKNYGGRGIKVCNEWQQDFTSFYEWSNSNGYKQGLTIDRIDNNGNYCPENCRWVDRIIQANNTRGNKYITINNQTDTLSNWLRHYNLTYDKYYKRIKKGFTEQQALTMS
jgi:hypothetical protein